MDDRFENVDGYLFLSLGFSSKHNAWAGPDHWKYQKSKGVVWRPVRDCKVVMLFMFLRIQYRNYFRICFVVSEVHPTSEDGSTLKTRQPRSKRQAEIDLNFTNSLEKKILDIFSPPKNPKSLLLPESRLPCNTKLPEDCHYQPEDLIKLFLLPNVKVVSR